MNETYSEVEQITRDYYNSASADRFYETVWGGEDIHIGVYDRPDEPISQASRRTVERMDRAVGPFTGRERVLDVGSGYGGSARFLARRHGCHVTCLNLSEVQNRRNRALNQQAGLADRIEVVDGSFEELPLPAAAFDLVWSQDAMLHSGQREQVLREVDRVLKPGRRFIFTDPMQSDDCPLELLQPVLDRIHLASMGSPGFYREAAARLGWREECWLDLSEQLPNHYRRVREEVIRREKEVLKVCEPEYIDRLHLGLQHWIDAGRAGRLKWGIFIFRRATA
jgi:sarcosine/dimethylglycine N-methyltransferase